MTEKNYYYSRIYRISSRNYVGRVFWKVIDRAHSHLFAGFGISGHELKYSSSPIPLSPYSETSTLLGRGWEMFLGFEWFPAWPSNVAISAEFGYKSIDFKPKESFTENYEDYKYTVTSTPLKIGIVYYLGEKEK